MSDSDQMRTHVLPALAVGVIAGFTSGLFGVGGGLVIVPGLVWLAGYQQRLAHGTSLTAIIPIAVAGTIGYASAGEVDWVVAGLLAAGAFVGAPLGVALLARLGTRWLQIGFAAVLLLTAVRLVVEAGGDGREAVDLLAGIGYVVTGFAAGVLSGLMGVGGGLLMVPAMTILFGFPLVLAKGTSLAVIIPTALIGTLRNLHHGSTHVRDGVVIGLAGIATAGIASQVSLALDPVLSAWLFGGLLVLMATRMLLRARPA